MNKLKSLLLGNKFLGIEIFSKDAKLFYEVLEIHKKKNDLTIVSNERFESIEKLTELNFPCHLVINTNQVLHKEIDSIEANDLKLIQKAYPNLKTDEFYYEIWRLEKKSIVFICRKEYVNKIIENCKDSNINVCVFSLGLSSISGLIPFLKNDILNTNAFSLDFKSDQKILTSENDTIDSDYVINGLQVSNKNIVAFSAIINFFLNDKTITGNSEDDNKTLKDTFLQAAFFTKGLRIIIGFLLSILLINFLIFNYYFKKSEKAAEDLMINNVNIEKIKELKENIKFKETMILGLSKSNFGKSSILLNEISKSIPTSILLRTLTLNPLQKKIKSDTPILTEDRSILITGESIDKTNFTDWITYLENITWIASVSIIDYGNDNTKEAYFEIKIKLTDEIEQKK